MREHVVVVATWHVAPGNLDAVLGTLAELRRTSLDEPGCLAYDVHQALDDPNLLVLVERYVDMASLDAHVASEHFQRLVLDTVEPRLASRQVQRLRSAFSS